MEDLEYRQMLEREQSVVDQLNATLGIAPKEISESEVSKAFKVIQKAMHDEGVEPGSYAHAWHCNVAMMCSDAIHQADIVDDNCMDEIHAVCNDAASRFMKICFDVETKQ